MSRSTELTMPSLIALFAGCLLYPDPTNDPCRVERAAQYEFLRSHPAAAIQWGGNGQVMHLKDPVGIVLPSGVAGFQVDQPARELLEKIGPLLLATGTEELRVLAVDRQGPQGPAGGTFVRMGEFIRGLEVVQAYVNIVLDERTNEIILLYADFLPDRGLEHEPRLSAAEARQKLEAELREVPYQNSHASLYDTPPHLAYTFEQWGKSGGLGGALVWVFHAEFPPAGGEGQFRDVNADAATGKMTPRSNVLQYWDR
jgi:hypothetical protein